MAIRPTLGWNNRLVRRVMRHRSVTTLFPAAPSGTAWPTGTAWPAGSAPGAARSDQGATTDTGYIAVVIDPAANTLPTTVVATMPEVRVSRRSAATPTRAPLGEPARIVLSSGPAPVGTVPRPQLPTAARTTAVPASAPAVQIMPSVAPAPSPTPASVQPVQAQRTQAPGTAPTPEPFAPAVDDAGDTTLTDQVWRRLQTIFRRHQASTLDEPEAAVEPETAAEAEAPPPATKGTGDTPSAPATTSAATDTPSGPVRRMPDTTTTAQATRIADNAARTMAQATALPNALASQSSDARQDQRPRIIEIAHTTEPLVTDIYAGSPAEVDEAVQRSQAATVTPPSAALDRGTEPAARSADQPTDSAGSAAADTEAMATEAPATAAAAEPAQIAPASLTEPHALFEARPTLPAAPIERAAAPAQPRPQPVTEIQVPAADGTVRAIAEPPAATPQIAPPLEDVWAVQRLSEPIRTPPSPVAAPAADRDLQLPHATPAPMPDEIVEILERVAAGRPTQSTIEIILPRLPRPLQRPRPVREQQPAATLVAEIVAPREAVLLAQEAAQPTMPSAGATMAPEATVVPFEDASGEDGPRPLPTVAPPMVETEIGALPADLWELISETPPAPKDEPRSVPVEPDRPTTKPAPVPVVRTRPSGPGPMLQRSAIATTAQAPASATATQQSGPVQTRAQQAPPSEAAASETDAAATAETEAPGEPDVDVDKLAHRVYADIKRRLAVEWERIRGF